MRSRWQFPLGFAAVILGYIIVCDLVVTPIHERYAGNLTGWLNGLSHMVSLPGLCIAETAGKRFRYRTGWSAWLVMLVASVPFYLIIGALFRWGWAARPRAWTGASPVRPHAPDPEHPTSHSDAAPAEARDIPSADDPVLMTRRGLLLAARRTALLGIAGTASYSFLFESRNVEITRQVSRIRGLSPALAGLRIVHLTDLHHGPWTSLSYLRRVIAQTNALHPDLVVLTGDYVHQSDIYIAPVVSAMNELKARLGVVATLGNHDWWEDVDLTVREFARTSIHLIDNDRLFVTPEGTLERSIVHSEQRHALCVAGIGDLWEGHPACEGAFGGIPATMPRLLLSHNPDACEEPCLLKPAPRIDLMLSGHTHGGQISLPLLGTPITPSRYGRKYAAGLVQSPLGPVYVNRGIGTTVMPLRFGVRPEIAVIELRPA